MQAVPADDVGCRRSVISDERGERTKQNSGHELEVFYTLRICKEKCQRISI